MQSLLLSGDDASFDGGIDIKRGAFNVTLSYNHIHTYQKVSLNGHSDSSTEHSAARTTYYRNRFENVQSRLPLQRFSGSPSPAWRWQACCWPFIDSFRLLW